MQRVKHGVKTIARRLGKSLGLPARKGGGKDRAVADGRQDETTRTVRAWLEARRGDISAAGQREAEAIARFFGILAMPQQAAKGASRLVETCRRLDYDRLGEAFDPARAGKAPLRVRGNVMAVARQLRDKKSFELAKRVAGLLGAMGEEAGANRERMLIHAEEGRLEEALADCEALLDASEIDAVASVTDWLLVRLLRDPTEPGAGPLIGRLLQHRLLPSQLLEDASQVSAAIGALAAKAARLERGGTSAENERAVASARLGLQAIDRGMTTAKEAGETGASFDLTHIRLLGMRDRFAAAFKAMARYARAHGISRGAATAFGQVMDRYLRYRHSAGARTDLVAPLLDETVFAAYAERLEDEERAIWDSWPFRQNLKTAEAVEPPVATGEAIPGLNYRLDKRTRVLFVSSNWTFISPLISELADTAGNEFEFRTLDFQSLTLGDKTVRPDNFYFFSEASGRRAWKDLVKAVPNAARLLNWADVVFVEWANQPAVVLSNILPAHKRLVVRLHSYEAFSNWHYFVNWARVDETLFVADHIRQVFLAQNRLARESGLKSEIVANRHDFADPIAERGEAERRTLCMLGWATPNKDPIHALEILKALRAGGDDWRLRLVGGSWRPQAAGFEAEYRARFEAMLGQPALIGAVEFVPFTAEPASELAKAAYILSCSHREGTHEAVVEGLSAGCVPIIRNWPMVARFGGAHGQFAAFDDYIVSDVEVAADKIRSTPWTMELAQALHRRGKETFGIERTRESLLAALRRAR